MKIHKIENESLWRLWNSRKKREMIKVTASGVLKLDFRI